MAVDNRVAAVRDFNRFYTRRIGVLGEGLLHTGHSLTEARVLFELGQVEAMDVADLRATLGLDAGYLSRLLSRLDQAGVLRRERSERDARRQRVTLTPAGRAAFAELDARSAAENAALLDGLPEDAQRRLLGAMDAIRGVLAPPPAPAYVLRPPASGDYGWVVARHGTLYAQEYGWGATFESLVARVVADYVDHRDPRREAAWIADIGGEAVGSVFCVAQDERVARLRLLLVEPSARGSGIGARLVDECVRFARAAGYQELTLWTNSVLTAARRVYARAGFEIVDSKPHRSFGRHLQDETWSLAL